MRHWHRRIKTRQQQKRQIQCFVPECVGVQSVSGERSISGGHANHLRSAQGSSIQEKVNI